MWLAKNIIYSLWLATARWTRFFNQSQRCISHAFSLLQGDDTQDITGVMSDPDFIKNVLSTLPGVDPSSEAIQKVMVTLAQQDSDEGKDQDEPMDEDSSKDKKKDKK